LDVHKQSISIAVRNAAGKIVMECVIVWSPHGRSFCFAGFGTDRLRRQEAMKTATRENRQALGHRAQQPSN
jgi:hypothetical protein